LSRLALAGGAQHLAHHFARAIEQGDDRVGRIVPVGGPCAARFFGLPAPVRADPRRLPTDS